MNHLQFQHNIHYNKKGNNMNLLANHQSTQNQLPYHRDKTSQYSASFQEEPTNQRYPKQSL